MHGKTIDFKNLKIVGEGLNGKKVLAGGCFDILHIGHMRYLSLAKSLGDLLIVALESDEFIKTRKKKQPFHNMEERAEILAALEFVDLIVKLPLFKSDRDYLNLVKIIKPDIIAITAGDPQEKNKKMHAQKTGAQVVEVVPHLNKKASSLIYRHKDVH